MAINGFGRESGPAAPPKSLPLFGASPLTRSSPTPVDANPPSRMIRSYSELEAKAKRLACFKTDLSVPVQNVSSVNDSGAIDVEGPKPPGVIVGLCSDMCPVSEREQRERMGHLDQYERLDGDRNQSGKGLAVKKYTRTAEREAELIRPLPILQKTMDYLLNLLDRPYGDSFLGLYNFLWDRMRAIRMDLRMQHIFNLEAITMLEQMLRTQALASLHSGLQNNQGIPVAQVAKWLGLESEGAESLLEYHGFSVKEFDEPYMVKDHPFLNIDKDFPTKCSDVVQLKKAKHIVEDVSPPHQVTSIVPQDKKEFKPVKVNAEDKPKRPRNQLLDEDYHPSNLTSPPKRRMQVEERFQACNSCIPKLCIETQQIVLK